MKTSIYKYTSTIIIMTLFSCAVVKGQYVYYVKVLDSAAGNPVSFATVKLLCGIDTIVKLTGSDGTVMATLSCTAPTAVISHLTYRLAEKKLGMAGTYSFLLVNRVSQSDAAVVTGKKPLIQAIPGGYVFNPDRTVAGLNVDASQMLKKLPGVMPDQAGDLKVLGKEVSILVNGKPLNISGNELASYLRSFSADDVKSIRVLTNPSAQYDASGGAIIEIITNRSIFKGLVGRYNMNIATHDKQYSGLTFNYRSKKFSGNYQLSYDRNNLFFRENSTQQNYNTTDDLTRYEYNNRIEERPMGTTGISAQNDFEISRRSILGINFKYTQYENFPSLVNSLLTVYDKTDRIVKQRDFRRWNESVSDVYYGDINFRHNLRKKNSSFIADMLVWRRNAGNSFHEYLRDSKHSGPDSMRINQNLAGQDLAINSLATNFVTPVNDSVTFSAGLKTTLLSVSGRYHAEIFDAMVPGYTMDLINTFKIQYQEDIYAAFVNLAGRFRRLRYQGGLRYEFTGINLKTVRGSVQENNREFGKLFPALAVTYSFSKKSSFSAGYNKRINRVSYSQLNPLDFRQSPVLLVKGNPFLQPSLSDNVTISYNFQPGYGSNYSVTGSYSFYKSPFAWFYIPQAEPGVFLYTPLNHKSWTYYALSFFGQSKITKKINASLNMLLSRQVYDVSDVALFEPVPVTAFSCNLSLTSQLGRGYILEIFGNYRSPSGTVFGRGFGFQYVDVSLTKSFFKGALNVTANVNDVFDINEAKYRNRSPDLFNEGVTKNETRIGRVSFSYRFGSQKLNKIKDYSAQEEWRFNN